MNVFAAYIIQELSQELQIAIAETAIAPSSADTASPIEVKEWEFEYKVVEENRVAVEGFWSSLYSILLGQSTDIMKDKLKAHSTFIVIQASQDGIELLQLIKATTFTFNSDRVYTCMAMDKIWAEFYGMKQHPGQSVQSFYEAFRAKMGILLFDQVYVQEIAGKNGRAGAQSVADNEEAQERMIANRFVHACLQKEYKAHLH